MTSIFSFRGPNKKDISRISHTVDPHHNSLLYGSISRTDATGGTVESVETEREHEYHTTHHLHHVNSSSSRVVHCCKHMRVTYTPDVIGASMNFVNGIIGAGCIGYGGAIASSGGFASIISVLIVAYLTKLSFDLTISLSIDKRSASHYSKSDDITTTSKSASSFESLGHMAYGRLGQALVGLSKWFFSFGCMVAYIIIVKDNFAPAMRHLFGINETEGDAKVATILQWMLKDNVATLILSTTVILPLSLLREVSLLERFSLLKIIALILIAVVLFIFFLQSTTESRNEDVASTNFTNGADPASSSFSSSSFYSHWIQLRPGFIRNLGTFVLTYTANHTIHLVFFSLKPRLQTLQEWKKISLLSIVLSSALVLSIGLFPYLTFWNDTGTNLFLLYPPSPLVDGARLLLSLVMLLTYPMPFFSCRELVAGLLPRPWLATLTISNGDEWNDLLLVEDDGTMEESPINEPNGADSGPLLVYPKSTIPLPTLYHFLLTVALWTTTVVLALTAPSLGDVLNLVGCVTGTMISFILPGLFALRLEGYSSTALLLFVVGGLVGSMGTYFSLLHLIAGGD